MSPRPRSTLVAILLATALLPLAALSLRAQGETTPPTVTGLAETITLGGWIQPVWEYRARPGEEDRQGIFLRRARLDVTGSLMEGRVRFRLMPDLAQALQLRDGWMEVRGGVGLSLRMGQQTVPFDLQRERSMARAHFGERAIAARRFELSGGRDVGAVGSWLGGEGRARLTFGIFNGEGANRRELGRAPLFSGRIQYTLGGTLSSGETDLARSESLVLTLGGGTMVGHQSLLRPRPGFAADGATDWHALTVDLHARLLGASLAVSLFQQRVTPLGGVPGTPDVEGSGWFVSAGYLLPGGWGQLAVRHSEALWDAKRPEFREKEDTIGLTIFHSGHELQTRIQLSEERRPFELAGGRVRILTIEHQLLLGG